MRIIQRNEISDYQTYEEIREEFRNTVLGVKARRRIQVGDCFSFLFENTLTMRYQVQEMMRVEKIVKEKDILHELETYSALIGGDGELGCTLLIEIDDPEKRSIKLREWVKLPEHIYALLPNGAKIRPSFDSSQVGKDRLSSVQYLKFQVGCVVPVAIGIDLPEVTTETRLSEAQKAALAEDLA